MISIWSITMLLADQILVTKAAIPKHKSLMIYVVVMLFNCIVMFKSVIISVSRNIRLESLRTRLGPTAALSRDRKPQRSRFASALVVCVMIQMLLFMYGCVIVMYCLLFVSVSFTKHVGVWIVAYYVLVDSHPRSSFARLTRADSVQCSRQGQHIYIYICI